MRSQHLTPTITVIALALAVPAGSSAATATPRDQAPGESKSQYLTSGHYARDVVAASKPATAWIRERSDQLITLTRACRAYGLPVGAGGRATTPTVDEPTAAERGAATATKRRAATAKRRARAARRAATRLARKRGASRSAVSAAKRRARVLERRARVARARARRAAEAAKPPTIARPSAASCRGIIRPAVVFDIDETLLSNYIGGPASNTELGGPGQFPAALAGTGTRMPGVGDAYEAAKKRGFTIFLITARPGQLPGLRDTTIKNLATAGYSGYQRLFLKPTPTGSSAAYKTAARAEVEAEGYTIVANVGDQVSDLTGGHAERTFKIPNPFYTNG